MKSLKSKFLTLLLSAVAVCGYAQEKVFFTVEVPETVVDVDDVFGVYYSLNAAVEEGVEPSLSSVRGLTLTMGPMVERGHRSTITSTGETETVTTTYGYFFRAERSGDFTIPVCTLETRQGTYRSGPVEIIVLPNGDEEEEAESSAASANATPAAQSNANSRPAADSDGTDMFVQLELSSTSVLKGDSLTATLKLYSQRDVNSFGKLVFPSFEGFKVREIRWPDDIMPVAQESHDGKQYNTTGLGRYTLYPKRAGELTIAAGRYDIFVLQKKQRQGGGGSFSDFFDTPSAEVERVTLSSPEVTVMVYPSPDDTGFEDFVVEVEPAEDESVAGENANGNGFIDLNRIDDKTRRVALYSAIVLLFMLIGVYIHKLGARREAQFAEWEPNGDTAAKSSLGWHLPFIVGIIILIACIAVMW